MSRGWFLVVLTGLCGGDASAQSRQQGSAQGQLTVTATVVSSSTVVIGDDGQVKVVVANAPEAEVTALTPAITGNRQPVLENATSRQSRKHFLHPRNEDAANESGR